MSLRVTTKTTICAKHAPYFSGLSRRRVVETMVEGGPYGATGPCEGGACTLVPGTDLICKTSVQDHPIGLDLPWTHGPVEVTLSETVTRSGVITIDPAAYAAVTGAHFSKDTATFDDMVAYIACTQPEDWFREESYTDGALDVAEVSATATGADHAAAISGTPDAVDGGDEAAICFQGIPHWDAHVPLLDVLEVIDGVSVSDAYAQAAAREIAKRLRQSVWLRTDQLAAKYQGETSEVQVITERFETARTLTDLTGALDRICEMADADHIWLGSATAMMRAVIPFKFSRNDSERSNLTSAALRGSLRRSDRL